MTGPPARGGLLRFAPALTVASFGLPILAGLVGTLLPAFGFLPSIGGQGFGLDPWRALASFPGFATSLQLTIASGWITTILSLAVALGASAFVHHREWARRLGRAIAPLLAMPHSALAIGLAFLILPSGWIVRLVSPGLTGWSLPPDVSSVGSPSGWAMILGLMLKEVPYLMLMTLGALNQVAAAPQLAAARSLGYGPVEAWVKVVWPQIYPQIRLPVYAVLAFSLSVVDVALLLGPGNPPTLAVLIVRWFHDPDVQQYFPASAAAVLLLGITLASIACWHLIERVVAAWWRSRVTLGRRGAALPALAATAAAAGALLVALAAAAMLGLVLWSFARQWRFPGAFPAVWTLDNWARQIDSLREPAWTTLLVGACATALALVLVIACLENEPSRAEKGVRRRVAPMWPLYLPLLVPQVSFLFGAQVLLVRAGLDATLVAVVWSHLVFVLPYLFLSLADPWRAFDPRYARTALALGASRGRAFWRVKLPILLPPTLIACAVAFAVSAGMYLPTLFAGGGRIATLTTEAVTLAAGADRRVIGTWAVLQALLPLLAYGLAIALPRMMRAARGLR